MSRFALFRCAFPQAKAAVERWHYSRRMPAAGLDCYGVREAGRFVGVLVFGYGANPHFAKPFGLDQHDVRELARVALCDQRRTRTTAIVAACLRQLRRDRPEVRLVVSYADTKQGHLGTIYQAGNWTYLGPSLGGRTIIVHGQPCHPRSLYQRYGSSSLAWLRRFVDPEAKAVTDPPKHKYALGFDGQMRRRLRRLACPYPRAVKESQATRPVSDREGHVRSVLTAPREIAANSTTKAPLPKAPICRIMETGVYSNEQQ